MAIQIDRLWLESFRNHSATDLSFPEGTTAIVGQNGHGKTNLLEAVAHLAGVSLRGATTETMVAVGADRAVLRAEARRGNRALLFESELAVRGRSRTQLNRQPVKRRQDLLEAIAVTVFSPEDLIMVKGGPSERRRWLDDAVVGLDPKLDSMRADVDRILRQRNALLKQCKGRLDDGAAVTLDVWDERLAMTGTAFVDARVAALEAIVPQVDDAYRDLAGAAAEIVATYEAPWRSEGLAAALVGSRDHDVRRGHSTVGPHRDDVAITIDGLPSRTHASQGEQRSLSLSLRLAVHRAMCDRSGESPILLLDDVFSELDDERADALLAHLPPGQTLLTTAGPLPVGTTPDLVVRVRDGVVTPAEEAGGRR